MTIIKGNTKKGIAMVKSANTYQGYNLHDVYGTFSAAKYNAWDYCHNKCTAENGQGFHISSHNTFGFSVAWAICSPENGDIVAVRVETPQNSYKIINPIF